MRGQEKNASQQAIHGRLLAKGMPRCIHGEIFPCAQCHANRLWNEAATGNPLTDQQFEATYAAREE